jgi:hypothetical protein
MTKTERGWAGHFICAHECRFRRNTLLEHKDKRIVVSTVGNLWSTALSKTEPTEIGHQRYYETMAFVATKQGPYWDADVTQHVDFDGSWSIAEIEEGSDQDANYMHETIVAQIEHTMINKETQ